MSLLHDSYDFKAPSHGLPVQAGAGTRLQVNSWPGVSGEYHIYLNNGGQDLTIPTHYHGYASGALLKVDTDDVRSRIGTLTGTLSVDGVSYNQCTFVDFVAKEAPWLDASGVNGWQQSAVLVFRQRVST